MVKSCGSLYFTLFCLAYHTGSLHNLGLGTEIDFEDVMPDKGFFQKPLD